VVAKRVGDAEVVEVVTVDVGTIHVPSDLRERECQGSDERIVVR
jgi:hypothetical protein